MHIAIDARIIATSTGTYVTGILSQLEKIDHENTYSVLVFTKDKNYWSPTNPNFTVRTIDYPNYSLAEQIGFKQYLDKLNPDLVHFCMPQHPVFYKGKKIVSIHDLTLLKTWNTDKNWLVYHIKQLVGRFVFHHAIRTSQQIVTISNATYQELIAFDRASQGKTTVTPLAATVTKVPLEPYDLPYKQYLLYVGSQSDYKNIKRLGDAHQKLLADHPDLGLVLVGKKDAMVEKTKLYFDQKDYHNITFTGFVTNGERDWLFSHCAAYVFPSLMEGFGLPGLEAMEYGAPVVSSNTTSLPEVYEDAAEYFDPYDADSMATAIKRVLDDEKLRSMLIDRGHKQVKKYSWKTTAKMILEVYQQALNK